MQITSQRLWWINAALVILAAGNAAAADMPLKAAPLPPAPVVDSWAGFYLGGNVGYSSGRVRYSSAVSNVFPGSTQFGTIDTTASQRSLAGVIGGGQIGYNWQAGPGWVLGFETDFQGSGQRNRSDTNNQELNGVPPALQNALTTIDQKLDWFGTVRGRLGYTVGTVMFYGTGGYAYGRVEETEFRSRTPVVPGSASLAGGATVTATRSGWTAGAGAEAKLFGNWSAKIEYLYMDLGSITNNHNILITSGANNGVVVNNVTSTSHFQDHIFRAGLNYKF